MSAIPAEYVYVEESFRRQGFMGHLEAELVGVGEGLADLRLAYGDHLSQQHGYFHGGVIASLADVAGGYAGYSIMAPDEAILTVEFKINIVAPGQGDHLLAKGHVVKGGRRLIVTTADVFAEEGEQQTLVATMQQTLMRLEAKGHRPPG